MATITIIGAGAMGAAMTTPAAHCGHTVRLWGTWLDDDLLVAIRAGEAHPRLGVRIDERVCCYDSDRLEQALAGADLVVIAVASEGVVQVSELVAKQLRPGVPVLMTTKGFGRHAEGLVCLLPSLLRPILGPNNPLVGAGGPCKANEVAAGRPTATVHAGEDAGAVAASLRTDAYRVECTTDLVGVELAAATKNLYAIALGICDGLGESGDPPWHNLKAATFAQSVREMRQLTAALGGDPDTPLGLAGVGDLEVTGLSGRNKVYGVRLGRGEPSVRALEEMRAAGQTVEGVPAARHAIELVRQLAADDVIDPDDLPLLATVAGILDERVDARTALPDAVLPGRDAALPNTDAGRPESEAG